MAQVQQQQPQQQEDATVVSSKQQDHNLKRKAADPEEVAEDSENDIVESPEIKRARMEYLKRLYSGNKQQSEV